MAAYLARRLALAAATLWVVVTATFALLHALPGDPFLDPRLPPAVRANLTAAYGLDLPLPRQYLLYWAQLLHGRLGVSLVDPQVSVARLIAARLPVSAELGALALAWSLVLGVTLGLVAALRRGSPWDRASLAVAVVGLAVPDFVLAVLADWLFAVRLPWLPVSGWGGAAAAVLPSLALGMLPVALVARLVRSQAAELLGEDFVRTARAKGVGELRLLVRHVLRNAAPALVTVLGPLAAAVLTGSFAVERVFALPGLGSAYVQSVLDRDYPVVLATTILYAALLVGFNLLVDLAYAWLDPRVRLAGRRGAA